MDILTLSKGVGHNELYKKCQLKVNSTCARLSLGVEMEQVKSMKKSDFCSTVVLGAHLLLQIVLLVLFLKFFGVPSVEKYLVKGDNRHLLLKSKPTE